METINKNNELLNKNIEVEDYYYNKTEIINEDLDFQRKISTKFSFNKKSNNLSNITMKPSLNDLKTEILNKNYNLKEVIPILNNSSNLNKYLKNSNNLNSLQSKSHIIKIDSNVNRKTINKITI